MRRHLRSDMLLQAVERQHIGQYHKRIDQIGAFPDETHRDNGAEVDHDDIGKFIERDTFFTHKVFRCFFSEIGPSHQCGDGEGGKRDCQEGIADVGQVCESGAGQTGLGDPGDGGRVIKHVCDDNQTGDQAHDYGVPEYGSHRYICLYTGIFDMGSGCCDGRGADAGLVGEETSGDAVAYGMLHGGTGSAAGCGPEREGAFQDQQAGVRQYAAV